MLAPIGLDAINGDGGIKREGQAENLEEESKRYVRTPLKKASESEGKKVGKDKRDDSSDRALRANEGLDHRHSILPTNRQWNKSNGYFGKVLNLPTPLQCAKQAPSFVSRRETSWARVSLGARYEK